MGVAYGVDRWQDICCPYSAGRLQWRVKESWNGAGRYLTLTGERTMIKTIKSNLASNPAASTTAVPAALTTQAPDALQTGLLIDICVQILSFSKQIKKKLSAWWDYFSSHLACFKGFFQPSDDILKYSICFRIVSPAQNTFSRSAQGWKWNHSTNTSKPLFEGKRWEMSC